MYENFDIPEPYPYTNQPHSVIKHAELILSSSDSIPNYEYLREIQTL